VPISGQNPSVVDKQGCRALTFALATLSCSFETMHAAGSARLFRNAWCDLAVH